MSYVDPKTGYPIELANKVGHIKLVQDPMIQRLIECFEDTRPTDAMALPAPDGRIDLFAECPIVQTVTIDGGQQAVPNIARPERQIGFIQVAAQMVRIETLDYLKAHPLADPRDVRQSLSKFTDHTLAALPIAGMHMPKMTVRESIREAIHRFLSTYQLYDALRFLVYREWRSADTDADVPEMDCLNCDDTVLLARHATEFVCKSCSHGHKLGDYLLMSTDDSEEVGRLELVSSFRSALEVLALFSTIAKARDHAAVMDHTLFLLDGPLLLRANLARLVEPIRDFVTDHRAAGRNIYLVGVEKGGDIRAYADEISSGLIEPGDYKILTFPFIVEQISGRRFNGNTYRNRVNYGAKVVVRLGDNHVVVLNIPTGAFVLEPTVADLVGFEAIVRILSKVVSYRYENALIPIVLINEAASISNQPSGGILEQFVKKILDGAD